MPIQFYPSGPSNNYGRSQGHNPTWKDYLAAIQDSRLKLAQHGGMMTEFERYEQQQKINAQVNQYRQVVTNGVLGEWESAINGFKSAVLSAEKARAAEVTRWDSGKLLTEMQALEMRVSKALAAGNGNVLTGEPGKAERLAELYREARASQDPIRQRAAAEVFRGLEPGGDFEINSLAKKADQDYSALRITAELRQAEEARGQALSSLLAKREELRSASLALGEGDPAAPFSGGGMFDQAFMRLQRNQSGEIKVYPADAPEVTGVFWKQELETQGG